MLILESFWHVTDVKKAMAESNAEMTNNETEKLTARLHVGLLLVFREKNKLPKDTDER